MLLSKDNDIIIVQLKTIRGMFFNKDNDTIKVQLQTLPGMSKTMLLSQRNVAHILNFYVEFKKIKCVLF